MRNATQKGKGLEIFGYPLRDWIVLFVFITGGYGSMTAFTGTPNQTKDAVTSELSKQTRMIETQIQELTNAVNANTRMMRINADDIGSIHRREVDTEKKIDELRSTILQGLKNLEGYHKPLETPETN